MSLPSLAITETLGCRPDTTVGEAMQKMGWLGCQTLPVCDEDQQWVGSINLETLRLYTQYTGKRLGDIRVWDAGGMERPASVSGELPARISPSRPGWSWLRASRELLSPTGVRSHLSPAQWRLLEVFVEHSGSVLSRDMLMKAVRGRSTEQFDRYIDVLVGTLRRKFGERAGNARVILTVHNEGYLCTLTKSAIEP